MTTTNNKRQSFTHNVRYARFINRPAAIANNALFDLLATVPCRGETLGNLVMDCIGGARSLGNLHLDDIIDNASQTEVLKIENPIKSRRMADGEIYACHFSKSAMEKARKQVKLALLALRQENYNKYYRA